jgi:MATE family multidrug resistance protein
MHAGVAIGGGWQALVAYINIGCYYVFGLPLGYLLGYKANLGVEVRLLYVHAAHSFF